MIHLHKFTEERMNNLVTGILEINRVPVRHRDLKPRNMMVVTDDLSRVVWIDFDRAETYNDGEMTEKQKALLAEEEDIVSGILTDLVSDA